MRILVLGHGGMLGSELVEALKASHEVMGRGRDDFRIESIDDCRSVIEDSKPDVVVNAAAYTNVEKCETSRELSKRVNVEGIRNVAMCCRGAKVKVVQFSTDYVFDGRKRSPYREDDICNPLNVYGKDKLEGELFLREICDDYLLIRTSWLFGRKGDDFVGRIMKKVLSNESIRVVNDQRGSPTYAVDLSKAAKMLIEGDLRGMYHICNRGNCSWYEFAERIVERAGVTGVSVLPVESRELSLKASRPAYSVLSTKKFTDATGKTLRFWQHALEDCMEGRIKDAMMSEMNG